MEIEQLQVYRISDDEESEYNDVEQEEEEEEEEDSLHEWTGGYHCNFPFEWRTDYIPETGPEECLNCAAYGCYRGDFIGYCANCALLYNGTRGRGFISICMENDSATTRQWSSAFETYLCECDFARFYDEQEEEEEQEQEEEWYEDEMDNTSTDYEDDSQNIIIN
jgi:hypothetical protein